MKGYLSDFVWDAYRFFLAFQTPMKNLPLQVYASALVFAPTSSIVRQTFKGAIPEWVRVESNSGGQQFSEARAASTPRHLSLGVRGNWPTYFTVIGGGDIYRSRVAYSGDGRRLIAQSIQGFIEIRDATTGTYLRKLRLPTKNAYMYDEITALSLHGTRFACVESPYQPILVLDVANETWQGMSEAHRGVDNLMFSKTGDWLASISEIEAKLWNARTGDLQCKIQGRWKGYRKAQVNFFLGDSGHFATALEDGTIEIWNAETGCKWQKILQEADRLVPFPGDRSRLLILHDDKRSVWNTVTQQCETRFEEPTKPERIHPDQRCVFISENGEVMVYVASDMSLCISTPRAHVCFKDEFVNHQLSIAISPNSRLVAAVSSHTTTKIFAVAPGVPHLVEQVITDRTWVEKLFFSPDSRFLGIQELDAVAILTCQGLSSRKEREDEPENAGAISGIAVSPGAQLFATITDWNKIQFWKTPKRSWKTVAYPKNDYYITQVAFSWDGEKLAFGTLRATVHVLDIISGALFTPTDPNEGHGHRRVTKLSFSKDGTQLASTSESNLILWNIEHTASIKVDGSGSSIPDTMELIRGDYMTMESISSLVFSEDGILVVCSRGGVSLWNAKSGEHLVEIPCTIFESWYFEYLTMVSIWHAGGSIRVLLASSFGELRVLDSASGRFIRTSRIKQTSYLSILEGERHCPRAADEKTDLDQLLLNDVEGLSRIKNVSYNSCWLADEWIVKDGRCVIWLPPGYRPQESEVAVDGSAIAIGKRNGNILALTFLDDKFPS